MHYDDIDLHWARFPSIVEDRSLKNIARRLRNLSAKPDPPELLPDPEEDELWEEEWEELQEEEWEELQVAWREVPGATLKKEELFNMVSNNTDMNEFVDLVSSRVVQDLRYGCIVDEERIASRVVEKLRDEVLLGQATSSLADLADEIRCALRETHRRGMDADLKRAEALIEQSRAIQMNSGQGQSNWPIVGMAVAVISFMVITAAISTDLFGYKKEKDRSYRSYVSEIKELYTPARAVRIDDGSPSAQPLLPKTEKVVEPDIPVAVQPATRIKE